MNDADFAMMFSWFVGCLISGLIGHLIGRGKGRGKWGFWLSFLLGFIGWIITAIMRETDEHRRARMVEDAAFLRSIDRH